MCGVAAFDISSWGVEKVRIRWLGGCINRCLFTALIAFLLMVGCGIGLNYLLDTPHPRTSRPKPEASNQTLVAVPSFIAAPSEAMEPPAAVAPAKKAELPAIKPPAAENKDAPYRTWASANGKFTVVARLLDYTDEDAVLLRREPRKVLNVPLVKLSKPDQACRRKQARANLREGHRNCRWRHNHSTRWPELQSPPDWYRCS